MKTLLGETFARNEILLLAYVLVPLVYHLMPIGFVNKPLSAEQLYPAVRMVR